MGDISTIKLTDKNGNDITAQQAYDAAMSGPVYVFRGNEGKGNLSIEAFIALDLYAVIRENENIVSIAFSGIDGITKCIFYAGQNPNDIAGGGPV